MTDEPFAALKRILTAAIDLPAERRAAFVASECGGDEALRAEVMAKLSRLGRDPSILATGGLEALLRHAPGGLAALALAPSAAREAEGRFRVLQKIGEGGFGDVHLAEQTEPVRRRVALKILKPGLDTRAVLARFDAERQALALMDHPCIAKVFGAGETAEGRPYFSMEYVEGLPITEYCDRNRLDTRRRLELFLRVCDGVQHAHQKAVIHRDIKPSNVLAGRGEEGEFVKVIDFGIAKAVETPLTERTLQTEAGQLIGTPEYMSPEQAERSWDVDTRTDVYSLGAMLYELLTGQRPFDSSILRQGVERVRATLRDADTPRPSTRVSTATGEDADRSAAARRTTPRGLAAQLRGDLDWITLRAVEKDRARRYESPSALAADIVRHLRHEAVQARPPTVPYRLGRFVRRNRIAVTASVVLVSALGMVAIRERSHTVRIEREQARSERASSFLADMLGDVEPQVLGAALWSDLRDRVGAARAARGGEAEAALASFDALTEGVNATDAALRLLGDEILARAERTLEASLSGDPLVAARIHAALGSTYRKLGRYDRAETQLRAVLALRDEVLDAEDPAVADAKVALGSMLVDVGALEEAEALARDGLAGMQRAFGRESVEAYRAHHELAHVLASRGQRDEAEEHLRGALAGLRRAVGDDDPRTLDSINNLGHLLQEREKYDEAEELWRESLERRRRVLGESDPTTLESMSNLGFLLQGTGRLDEAEPYYRAALEGMRRELGDGHPWTLTLHSNLGYLLKQQGRLEEAAPLYRAATEGLRRVVGADSEQTLMAMNNLAFLLMALGNAGEAETTFRETCDGMRRVLGEDHPTALASLANLGWCYRQQGRAAEAVPLYGEAVDGFLRTLGENESDTQWAMYNHAGALLEAGRVDEAASSYDRVLRIRREVRGEEHPKTSEARCGLARARAKQGRTADAIELLRISADCGYDLSSVAERPEFTMLRDDPGFREAIAVSQARNGGNS